MGYCDYVMKFRECLLFVELSAPLLVLYLVEFIIVNFNPFIGHKGP